jgi:hypothetical protein
MFSKCWAALANATQRAERARTAGMDMSELGASLAARKAELLKEASEEIV